MLYNFVTYHHPCSYSALKFTIVIPLYIYILFLVVSYCYTKSDRVRAPHYHARESTATIPMNKESEYRCASFIHLL